MMNTVKAILGGLVAIIIMGLLAQLMILFVGVAYFSLVKVFPSLSFLTETTTIMVMALTAVIGFLGGIVTADLARKAVVIHCLVVGFLAGTLSLVPSLIDGYEVTLKGVLILVIFLFSTVAGGQYWKKKHRLGSDDMPVATKISP